MRPRETLGPTPYSSMSEDGPGAPAKSFEFYQMEKEELMEDLIRELPTWHSMGIWHIEKSAGSQVTWLMLGEAAPTM